MLEGREHKILSIVILSYVVFRHIKAQLLGLETQLLPHPNDTHDPIAEVLQHFQILATDRIFHGPPAVAMKDSAFADNIVREGLR